MEESKEPKLKITHRNLPHWELDGSVYFITFNTWEKLELTLEARQVVLNACKFFNNQTYQIFAFTPEEYPFFWQEFQPNPSF